MTWRAYTARAWPTLVVIDPEGFVVASMSGEGHGPGLASLVAELIEEHRAKGTLQPGDGHAAPHGATQGATAVSAGAPVVGRGGPLGGARGTW